MPGIKLQSPRFPAIASSHAASVTTVAIRKIVITIHNVTTLQSRLRVR